ncbi:MAG: ABC transporter ATP-binding protein [Bacteriovoracaceae bacterium]|nr:ABC transporter ATP-binding protein [Bacteriovoracaceae bacterium]
MKFFLNNALCINEKNIHLDFELKNGLLNYLKGPNGVGKSSLLNLLVANLLDNNYSYCQQSRFSTLNNLRVKDYQKLIARYKKFLDLDLFDKLLKDFSLSEKLSTQINVLSGGENQLLKLATHFSFKKDIYILDEPFQYLDDEHVKKVKTLLKDLIENEIVLIVEHQKYLLESFEKNDISFKKVNEDLKVINECYDS